MAITVKSAQQSADKWATVTPARLQDYTDGVRNAGSRWQSGVDAAAPLWSQAVQEAAARGEFARGVAGKGAKYSTNAGTLGAQRWSGGIAAGKPSYQTAVAPYLNTIAGLTLPPAQSRGNPANYQRVSIIGDALHQLRISS